MSPLRPVAAALLLLLGAACTQPPPEAYLTSTARSISGDPVGADARGEACIVQPGAGAVPADGTVTAAREVFCGGWTQPAARILQLAGPADAARLDQLASGGLWRSWLEQRNACGAPQPATLAGGVPARVLACTRRVGNWPHLAVVAAGPGGPVLADGIATAAPVMERLATGQASAAAAAGPQARSAALEVAVRRLSAEAFSTSDISQYERAMSLGRELNQADNFAAAEDAFRAALAIQERALGRDNPGATGALTHLALNLSNQGRHQEAALLFARAETQARRSNDPTDAPRLLHYRGIATLNAGDPAEALVLLRQADAAYAALVPPSILAPGGEADTAERASPTITTSVAGLAETRRYTAIALGRLGEHEAGPALIADSRRLLRRAGVDQGLMIGRSLRAEAFAHGRSGRDDLLASNLEAAARRFAVAAPGERPEALTLFLAGRRRLEAGRRESALEAFRAGAGILRARQIALPVQDVLPYLDALDAEARAKPAEAEALRREMFLAIQLAQRSSTVRFVQQASARLGAAGGDRSVAAAVRRLQDSDQALRALFAERDAGAGRNPALDRRIAEAQAQRAEAEAEVAAAAPGYRQLLLSAIDAEAAAAALAPDEALVTMLIGRSHGWVLALRDGKVSAARTTLTDAEATRLVAAIRAGVIDAAGRPGRFDTASAAALYTALLRPLAPSLEGAATLHVVPDGPLLAIPFGLLLTGPAERDQLIGAPWLIRRHAIAHVPSPQTFVSLRAAGARSTAPDPWIGFGDFVPPSRAQLEASFPRDRCANDATMAQGLVRLPGTRGEVLIGMEQTGARPQAVHLGPAFTAAALRAPEVGQARVVHLATHALLPGELSCLTEPSVVVSAPAGARNADQAFMRASELLNLKLDADLVILSACNTAGPGGEGGGEALSGLARAFFFAGARGLLVTHWAAQDDAAALTVSDALRRQRGGASSAAALRGAQMLLFEDVARRPGLDAFAHPFYWAPFALLGDGQRGGAGAPARTADAAGMAPAAAPASRL